MRERPVHRKRAKTLRLACAAVPAAVLATLVRPPAPLLVWNASASSPPGLYLAGPAQGLRAGDMAIAWPPDAARRLGARRRYLPGNVPLVKRVAAAAGDRVCAAGSAVFVNGVQAALRRRADPSGRPLPAWSGCKRLGGGDLLLLSDAPGAFDGRYFGITRTPDVLGSARLVWAR
jgi:type IV secretory pathway protease TraF